jgi:hypothetical protein
MNTLKNYAQRVKIPNELAQVRPKNVPVPLAIAGLGVWMAWVIRIAQGEIPGKFTWKKALLPWFAYKFYDAEEAKEKRS